MEQRYSMVTLGVADLGRARRFYEAGLGWQPAQANDDIAFFQAGNVVLGLYGRAALAEDANLTNDGQGFGGITLAHNVRSREDVDATLAQAAAAGATILKAAEDTFWGGYSGYFADPDGHPWEVAWNPFWTLREDGSIELPATDASGTSDGPADS